MTFTNPAAEVEKNGRGQYLIPPPSDPTGEPVAWTRATTFITAIKDTYGLELWKRRMAGLGLAARPDLLARVQSTDPNAKRVLDAILDDALEAAAAGAKANVGTALHSWTEQLDAGHTPNVGAEWQPDIDAYQATLAAHGVAHVPGMTERTIVIEALGVAGTFDRLSTLPILERPAVADLKTGNVEKGWEDIALQLALYAHGDAIWDPAAGTFEPMPEVDQDVGLVIHLPAGTGACTLYLVDIRRAWEMVKVCGKVRDWRSTARSKTEPIAVALEAGTPLPAPAPAPAEPAPAPAEPLYSPPLPRVAGPHELDLVTERLDWLRDRALDLCRHAPTAEGQLVAGWPDGVPTFADWANTPTIPTPDELDQVDRLVTSLEGEHQAPFTSDPDPLGFVAGADPRRAALDARVAALPPDLADSVLAGAPSGAPTVITLDEVHALLEAAEAVAGDRWQALTLALDALPDSVTGRWVADVTGTPIDDTGAIDTARVTEDAIQSVNDLADAALAGVLEVDGPGLTPADSALDDLVDRFGGKRHLTAAAKPVADELGLERPRAAANVLDDLRLVARLAVTDAPASAAA